MTVPLLRPAVAMLRGVVCWRRISRLPILTLRAGPSVRKTMRDGGVGAGGLETNRVTDYQRTCDGVRRWCHGPEHLVLNRIIVKAPGELPDDAGGLEPAQSRIDGIAAAEALEMLRSEYPTPSVAVNTASYLRINGL